MRLKHVKLTNCLAIEEMEINLGKITLIDGASETGKTSIIDSIRKGFKNEDIRPKFVNGEGKGIVFMQFDEDMEVTRTVKNDNKSTLKILKDGMAPQSPQGFLNALFGENDFAPVDWLKKKDKEQTEDLLKLMPIQVTNEDIEQLIGKTVPANYNQHGLVVCEEVEKHLMEVRKEINADVKAYKINIEDAKAELPADYEPERYRNVVLSDLFNEISKAERINNEIDKSENIITNANANMSNIQSDYDARLEDLVQEFKRRKQDLINSTNEKIEAEKAKVVAAELFIKEHKKTDTTKMKEEVAEIERGQGYLRTFDKLQTSKTEFDKWSKEADKLTDMINKVREYPTVLLSKAKAPIEGMSVKNGMIEIDGLPIKNLSDGAKMRLAIKVAKATSGELKLILLNGFEQLNWSLQKEMFKEMQDDAFQYIITRVTDGPLAISHIQDGRIINTQTGEVVEL